MQQLDLSIYQYKLGHRPYNSSSDTETQIIESEITKLLNKGVIVQAVREDGDFRSPIFIREKEDGSYHLILNLKALTKTITYHHFEMGTLSLVVKLMRPNCFMATIDLKDAYYSGRLY